MPRPRKNPVTDPDGQKARAKEAQAGRNSDAMRERIKAHFETVGSAASEVASNVGTTLEPITNAAAAAASVVGNAATSTATAVVNGVVSTVTGYQNSYASSNLTHQFDPRGGLTIPEMEFAGSIPSDLLHPSGLSKISEEELTAGLAEYAGATRAQRLYQAGFKYIEEVGKTKQQYHKAEQSIIKSATENIKVQQEIFRFDKQNVELSIDREKLEHSHEKLKQSQVVTVNLRSETSQIAQKLEAQQVKRDAEIKAIYSQSNDIIQKYLKDSVNS
ncbi:MAG: hypothetical protein H0X31_00085 [Nostocaceae cyanobacterium]|nr:hypothetical protein [Nostocaceae cyanobacterium]